MVIHKEGHYECKIGVKVYSCETAVNNAVENCQNCGTVSGMVRSGRPRKTSISDDPNGSCLFATGSPTDTVGSQNFQTFSTRQTPHFGD